MDDKPSIEPQNQPLWIIATLVLAAIATVLGFTSHYRLNQAFVLTQAELKVLNGRIETLKKQVQSAPAAQVPSTPAQSAAPAAPAAPAK